MQHQESVMRTAGRIVDLAPNCCGYPVLQKAPDCKEELLRVDPATTLVNKHASHVSNKPANGWRSSCHDCRSRATAHGEAADHLRPRHARPAPRFTTASADTLLGCKTGSMVIWLLYVHPIRFLLYPLSTPDIIR
ncbi:hypothetical protein B0H14DRAFT_3460687 [Mycena olivaceomarginata]|nr:hypothetical protein B0H14DRAFT_3460687 [Mycena olivaceomarginata]